MENLIYHPVTGEQVALASLEDKYAFIEDRLFTPVVWEKFYYDEFDEENKTFGIEIELNTPIDTKKNPQARIEICKQLLRVLNKDGKHFHIMRDNSVRNGIELVSAPMTYKYWTEKFNVKEVDDLFKELRLTATVDTGLHIHVGENHTRRHRELYLQFFAISYPVWIYLSDRRYERIQERYVSTNYFVEKPQLKKRYIATIDSLIKTGTSKVDYEGLGYYDYHIEDRYLGLNFFNKKTIEFRMFAGTNNFFDIFTYLTFVNVIVKMVDEITNTRINNVFDLDTFVKRSQSELILQETVKYIRFVNLKENEKRVFDNHFLFLDSYWYRVSINNVKRKELAMTKNVYKQYLKMLNLIDPLNPNHNCAETHSLKKDIDQHLINEVLEVVLIEDDLISMASVRGMTDTMTLTRDDANRDYIFLRGVSRHLILNDLK